MLVFNDYTPSKKSEEGSHQRLSSSFGVISPGPVLLLFALVALILVMTWFLVQPPSCDPEDQVELTGILMGFERNETRWDVRLNNKSFVFDHFDKSYMEKMLGENVTITCCLKTSRFQPYSIYSALNCYINDNQESD